jgi:hypothetical protein
VKLLPGLVACEELAAGSVTWTSYILPSAGRTEAYILKLNTALDHSPGSSSVPKCHSMVLNSLPLKDLEFVKFPYLAFQ